MAERSDLYHDARVQKEANSLTRNGYKVIVFGLRSTLENFDNKYSCKMITNYVLPRKFQIFRKFHLMILIIYINIKILFVRASNYHAHNTFFLPGMYISKMIYGGVLIYDSHEVQWESSKLASLKEKYFINKVDKIINVSHGRAKAQAERYNIPINNICVISNYPMLSKNIVQKQKIGNDKYTRFVFSGGLSLTDNKIDNFIRAIKDYPEISFDLLAFCYDNSEMILKNLIRDYKLENRVKFLPLVKPNEVLSTITEYDFTVNLMTNPQNLITINYHSINKIYEAISAGLPILCSDLPSFKDEIVDNGIGYSVNPFSVDSIKKGIEAIKKNDHKVMREKAFELAEKRFNWANEEVKLLNLYKNL